MLSWIVDIWQRLNSLWLVSVRCSKDSNFELIKTSIWDSSSFASILKAATCNTRAVWEFVTQNKMWTSCCRLVEWTLPALYTDIYNKHANKSRASRTPTLTNNPVQYVTWRQIFHAILIKTHEITLISIFAKYGSLYSKYVHNMRRSTMHTCYSRAGWGNTALYLSTQIYRGSDLWTWRTAL